jgi:hypothetical protein
LYLNLSMGIPNDLALTKESLIYLNIFASHLSSRRSRLMTMLRFLYSPVTYCKYLRLFATSVLNWKINCVNFYDLLWYRQKYWRIQESLLHHLLWVQLFSTILGSRIMLFLIHFFLKHFISDHKGFSVQNSFLWPRCSVANIKHCKVQLWLN